MINHTKNKTWAGGILVLLTVASALGAGEMANGNGMQYDQSRDRYRANELSLDVFGTGSVGKYTIEHLSGDRVRQNGELGAGLGLNYFFTRHIGISGDVYSENDTGTLVDSASGSLTMRLPLGASGFAPYAFGGGGRQFDRIEAWFGQGGAGMEYRFTPHVGMFVDARLVYPEETKYYGLARLGLRFAF